MTPFFHGNQTCNASIFDPTITMVQKLIKNLINLIGPREEIQSPSQKHSFHYLMPNILAPKGVPCRMTCHFNALDPNPHVKSLGPNFKFFTDRIALFHFQIGLGP